MMKRVFAIVSGLLLVAGCSTFSAKPESINQSFYLAYALVQSAYDSIEIAILGGHIKTANQARELKAPVDQAKSSLDAARAAFDAGLAWDTNVFNSTRSTLLLLQQTLIALGGENPAPPLAAEPEGATP